MCLPRFDIEKSGFILECALCHDRRIFIRTRVDEKNQYIAYDLVCRNCGHRGSVCPPGHEYEVIEMDNYVEIDSIA